MSVSLDKLIPLQGKQKQRWDDSYAGVTIVSGTPWLDWRGVMLGPISNIKTNLKSKEQILTVEVDPSLSYDKIFFSCYPELQKDLHFICKETGKPISALWSKN